MIKLDDGTYLMTEDELDRMFPFPWRRLFVTMFASFAAGLMFWGILR